MNPSRRSRPNGDAPKGRLRLVLLAAFAAAILLVPAAQAFAETGHVKINIEGTGSGEVESVPEALSGVGPGSPAIHCSYNGSTIVGGSVCENTPDTYAGPGFYAENLKAAPALGSELVGWTVTKGHNPSPSECESSAFGPLFCFVFNEEEDEEVEWEITAEFTLSGPLSFKLNLNTSGSGSGSFECEVEATTGPCETEYEEGTEVKVIPVPDPGSEFVEFNTENGGECAGATCEFTMEEEHTANAKINLETFALAVNESGPGALNVECDGGPCASLTEIPYGTSVKVTAQPNVGAETTAFEGTGSAAGCEAEGSPCTFTMKAASSVTGEFELEEETLTIQKPGSGTGTVECNGGSCAGPWFYGETIEVTATPTGGSTLGPLSGTGSASACAASPCSFEIKQATTISVTFNPPGAATLTVAKGGNGAGTVESTTGGIQCGPICSGSFVAGEAVILKEVPASPGSIFVAWSGNCTPISLTECEVEEKSGGSFVTATFASVPVLSEFDGEHEPLGEPCGGNGGTKIEYAGSTQYVCNGLIGEDGESGKGIEVIPSAPGCPEGGITVQVEGEPSTAKEICNGEKGAEGEQGEDGENGERGEIGFPGPEGTRGPVGPAGQSGSTGSNGAQGAQGPRGPRGEQGPAGKVSVNCKVTGAQKVTCKVLQSKANKRHHLRWRLMAGGHAQSHGSTSVARLNRVLSHLKPGRYVLHVNGQRTVVLIPAARG